MRCDDCLDELGPRHFIVLDIPADDPEGIDDKHVCADCVGWYDDPIEVETAA